jgi:hypothetical protein
MKLDPTAPSMAQLEAHLDALLSRSDRLVFELKQAIDNHHPVSQSWWEHLQTLEAYGNEFASQLRDVAAQLD